MKQQKLVIRFCQRSGWFLMAAAIALGAAGTSFAQTLSRSKLTNHLLTQQQALTLRSCPNCMSLFWKVETLPRQDQIDFALGDLNIFFQEHPSLLTNGSAPDLNSPQMPILRNAIVTNLFRNALSGGGAEDANGQTFGSRSHFKDEGEGGGDNNGVDETGGTGEATVSTGPGDSSAFGNRGDVSNDKEFIERALDELNKEGRSPEDIELENAMARDKFNESAEKLIEAAKVEHFNSVIDKLLATDPDSPVRQGSGARPSAQVDAGAVQPNLQKGVSFTQGRLPLIPLNRGGGGGITAQKIQGTVDAGTTRRQLLPLGVSPIQGRLPIIPLSRGGSGMDDPGGQTGSCSLLKPVVQVGFSFEC